MEADSNQGFIGNDQDVCRNFDLSQNKSLRTLETTARSITDAEDASGFLQTVLSTITSPLSLDVVIIYRESELGCHKWDRMTASAGPRYHYPVEKAPIDPHHSERFAVFREMHSVRKFRLVLCADVHACAEEYAVEMLERIRAVGTKEWHWGFESFLRRTLVISDRRLPRIRFRGTAAGDPPKRPIFASAL
jgi:hypothetical protein